MGEAEQLLTVGETARALKKCEVTVRAYEKKGILPAIKIARGMRLFRESDVRKLAEKKG